MLMMILIVERNFLEKILTLFDPLGLLAPFTIQSKLLMQETQNEGIDWELTEAVKKNMKRVANIRPH